MRVTQRVLIFAVLVIAGSSYVCAQTTEVVFVNQTGQTIYFLYASPVTADSWGEDLLGNTVLPVGGRFPARLRGSGAFDIRAIDSGGNEYIVWDRDFSRQRRVVLRADETVGVSSSPGSEALAWLNVRNETNYPVQQIVAIPAGTGDWSTGDTFLNGPEMLHTGEEVRIEFEVENDASLIYDVMLIDEDGDRYIKPNINLRLAGEVTFTLDDIRF